ncbi:MAG: AraC family transcriptional regulator [Mobilitalea sp.]
MEWMKSLNQAIEFIEDNIKENITCEDIAEHIYLSSFHFQRSFSLFTGLTVGEYIRNRRLSLAGHELLVSNVKVIDIALKYGYETPEGFSKAFARFHGVTPNDVKKQGTILKSFNRLILKIILEGGNCMDYRIEKKDAFQVVAKIKYFNEETSKTEIPKFWEEYYQSKLNEKVCGMLGICAQEKDNVKEWKYGIGCEVQYAKEITEEFETLEIPAYTWAIFTCIGAMPDAIQDQWKRVYSEWLPASNYELISDYDIELYTEGDNNREDYVSEIWIPVKEK